MTIKTILTEPNKILRQVSLPVDKVGNEERKLMDDMLETMYDAKGIGLAAIQIGVPKRIIVMDIGNRDKEKEPMYFVNPTIKNKNLEHSTYEEGCLSVPNQFAEVDRPRTCEVEFLDYNGKKKSAAKLDFITLFHSRYKCFRRFVWACLTIYHENLWVISPPCQRSHILNL